MKRKTLKGEGSIQLFRFAQIVAKDQSRRRVDEQAKEATGRPAWRRNHNHDSFTIDGMLMLDIMGKHATSSESANNRTRQSLWAKPFVKRANGTRKSVTQFMHGMAEMNAIRNKYGHGTYRVFSRKQSPYHDSEIGVHFTPLGWIHEGGEGRGLPRNCWMHCNIVCDEGVTFISDDFKTMLGSVVKISNTLSPMRELGDTQWLVNNLQETLSNMGNYDHAEHVRMYGQYLAWKANAPETVNPAGIPRPTYPRNIVPYGLASFSPDQAMRRVDDLNERLLKSLTKLTEIEKSLSYLNADALVDSLGEVLGKLTKVIYPDYHRGDE